MRAIPRTGQMVRRSQPLQHGNALAKANELVLVALRDRIIDDQQDMLGRPDKASARAHVLRVAGRLKRENAARVIAGCEFAGALRVQAGGTEASGPGVVAEEDRAVQRRQRERRRIPHEARKNHVVPGALRLGGLHRLS